MADDTDDFKIKGAASRPSSAHSSKASIQEQPSQPADTAAPIEADADTLAEQQMRFRWYQCRTPDSGGKIYYYHCDTNVTQWEEPDEPFFIFDSITKQVDPRGLQHPKPKPSREESLGMNMAETEEYKGYNPKIHGNYDPNADYAKWHEQKRAEEAAAADPYAQAAVAGPGMYDATMTLNRHTGHAQASDLNPERHSDQAKSGRQMGAFFDVDAAANAHGGKSLKEERAKQVMSKKQVKAFKDAKAQKKREKTLAFYKS